MYAVESFELNILKKNQLYELTFRNNKDERGILYKLTAVLFINGWNIIKADVTTNNNGQIEDTFLIEPTFRLNFTLSNLEKINAELTSLIQDELSVVEYLGQNKQALNKLSNLREFKYLTYMDVENLPDVNLTKISIRSKDRPGLLFEISQIMYLLSLDIIQFKATYDDDGINDKIYVRSSVTNSILEPGEIRELKRLFLDIFSFE